MQGPSLEIPLRQCELLPVLANHNALGPPVVDDEGRASFAVPLAGASHPVHVVSEGGGAPIPVLFGEEPPPPQLAAWAPRHPNHRRDLLAVVATSGVLTVYNIDAPASATSVALPLQHFSVKHRPRQISWLRQDGDLERGRLVLCVATTAEIALFAIFDKQRGTFPYDPQTLSPYRVITSPNTVDGFVWLEHEGQVPLLLVLTGGRMHVVRDACQGAGEERLQLLAEDDSTLIGPSVRGRCLGMVGTGSERLLVVASEQCGLRQELQRGANTGGLNSTMTELRRTQRRPPLSGSQEPAAADEEDDGDDDGGPEGIIDLLGMARANSGGGLLSNLLGGLRVGEEQPSRQLPPHGTLSLVRLPSTGSGRSYPLLKEELFSVPLRDPIGHGIWSSSMMATEAGHVVVGSNLSPTLLAYRLHGQSLKALVPLKLPEGYRPRGLALHKGRAFCLAFKRGEPEEEGGSHVTAGGRTWCMPSLFRFDLLQAAASDGEEGEAVQVALAKAEDEGAVLAFLREFRGAVLGRLDALEARLGRLEARVAEGLR